MAGYQGWFNAPGDGAGRGWYHYTKDGVFRPGMCTIDMWPDVSEYDVLYRTEFKYEDGTHAYTFSSADHETVDLHFRWMQEYGLDGVFMQRFVAEISTKSGLKHFNNVLDHARKAANRYSRAYCVMYDLSGMKPEDADLLLADMKDVAKRHDVFDHKANPSYLYHDGRPLVAVWGVGFNDGRAYGLDDAERIIDGLRGMGFSVMLGVPTYWRTLSDDTVPDRKLHDLVRKCDIVMPWFVGRYGQKEYHRFHKLISNDLKWAEENGVDYVPLCFPGFTWNNMKYPEKSTVISRNGGSFLKDQISYCIEAGARMLYIAMFDEVDEGTAIFKLAEKVPAAQPGSTFVPLDPGTRPDAYLEIVGEAGRLLKTR